MDNFDQIIQEFSAATVCASADDLTALAQLHTLLEQLEAELPRGEQWAGTAAELSGSTKVVLEKMMLHEVADAEASLREVGAAAVELLRLVGQSINGPSTSSAEVDKTNHSVVFLRDEVDAQDVSLAREFVVEAGEHIEASEAALLKLDQNPGDAEAIDALFRAFHTIKGVAGFIKLRQIGSLAHAVENLMDRARSGAICLNAESVDALLKSTDLMKDMIAALSDALKHGAVPQLQSSLPAILQLLSRCADSAATSVAIMPVVAPPPMVHGKATPATQPELQATTIKHEVSAAAAAPIPMAVQSAPVLSKSTSVPPTAAAATPDAATAPPAQPAAPQSDSVVKVSTDRLDRLINAIGELVIAQAMVKQDLTSLVPANHRVQRTLNHVGKIARELQDLSMSMRMVPIQGVFQKMSRLARDLARKSGKEFELEFVGGETELDRGLVETISDPLMHMIRNAADHGIENPEEREEAGKPRCGKVRLRAYHQAGNIVVQVQDDGRGLPKAKILKKAQAHGIVPPGKELNEQEIFKLIFAAGLSTAEKVTDVSGRGVGMDVVLRNVESLRGQIDIDSEEGKGSTFTIRLPLTLAVIDGLVVRVGRERYVIPISSIEQSLRPHPEQVSTVQNRGEMCLVREQLVPILRLHKLFDVQPLHSSPADGLLVLVQAGATRCCMMVDELLGQQQVVIKSLGSALGSTQGVSGGAILGDGNVSLILDIPGIIAAVAHN